MHLGGQHRPKLASQIEGKSMKKSIKDRCLPSRNCDACLIDFWKENGSMLAPRSDQTSMPTSKGRFLKTNENKLLFNAFSSFAGRTWHQKSIEHRSNIEAQDEVPLSIDFGSILMGFEMQVERENRAKSD